jgi:hypothetical protein
MTPFDIIKIINEKTLTDKETVISNYDAWIINKGMSNIMGTIMFAHEMSANSHLPKDMQFDFYYYGIPKGKRFGKWNKEDTTNNELINIICMILKVNRTIAKRYLALLSEEEKQKLLVIEGGK